MNKSVFTKLLSLILFFLTYSNFASNTTKHYSLDYLIDSKNDHTIDTVTKENFSPFTNSFPGLQQQNFWFRLQMNEHLNENVVFFTFNAISIDELIIHQFDNDSCLKVFEFKEKNKKNISLAVNPQKGTVFYFKVHFTKSIYMPFKLLSSFEFKNSERNKLLEFGLYYGFSFVVLLINMFFFYQTKDKFFVLYSLLALSISLILLELDDFFYLLFRDFSGVKYIALWLNTFLLIALALFTSNALKLDSYNPWLNKIGWILIVFSSIFFMFFSYTDISLWYSIGILFNTIALFLYWFSSILLFNKEVFAKFIFIGYTIIYISSIVYILPSDFGFLDIGFTLQYFKIGSIIEMVVFLYAISYRYKGELLAKDKIQHDLDIKNKEFENINLQREMTFERLIAEFNLTKREADIAELLLLGKTVKQIADKVFLSESTIKYHSKSIYQKAGVKNKVAFIAKYKILVF